MNLKRIIRADDESREVVERLVWENIDHKISSYLEKLDWKNIEWLLEIHTEKNKKWLFNWKLQITIDGKLFRYEREDYKNLDDLVNNLFWHFKEELAKK